MTKAGQPSRLFLILMLGALTTVSPFSIDFYLPAFPKIAEALGCSVAQMSLSVSSYFIGLSAGQLFYGPLLDRFGRKRPLYAGLAIYLIATVGCLTSPTVQALIAWRLLQAIGGCAAQVASVAMVHDFFPVKESARIFSLLMLILGVSPLFAPTVGSFVTVWFGWQAVFALLLGIVAAILAITAIWLPEGHAPDKSISLKAGPILRHFKEILTTPRFYTYALSGAFSFSGVLVYVAGSPAIFMEVFHVGPRVYGGIFALLSVGFIGSSQINIWLTKRFATGSIFRTAVLCQTLFMAIFLLGVYLGWFGLIPTIGFLFLYLSCVGLTYPNAAALALATFGKNAGSASALLGFIQIGVSALVSSGVGFFTVRSSLPTVAIIAVTSLIGLLVLRAGRHHIEGGPEVDAAVAPIH